MVSAKRDLTGQRFGKLVVVRQDVDKDSRYSYWICDCDCGNTKSIRGSSLTSGKQISCGCIRHERLALGGIARKTHGGTKTRLYKIWRGMIDRTEYPSSRNYQNYGARGIRICPEWRRDFAAFKAWAEQNGYRDDLSIDRIDNYKGYNPQNCRWATNSEQARNKRPDGKNGHRTFTAEQKEALRVQRSGDLSSSAKITRQEAIEIRIDYLRGERIVDIAKRHPKIHIRTVGNIAKCDTWKILPNTLQELEALL